MPHVLAGGIQAIADDSISLPFKDVEQYGWGARKVIVEGTDLHSTLGPVSTLGHVSTLGLLGLAT